MFTPKSLLEIASLLLIAAAAAILLHDLYRIYEQSNLILNGQPRPVAIHPHYRAVGRLAALGLVSLLAGWGF